MRRLKHLPFEQWPLADRHAWEAAFVDGDIFDETQGPGTHLSPGSRRTILFAYRRWLGFLVAHHPDTLRQPPAGRIVPEVLRSYVGVLQAEGAATTTAIAVHGLYLAARLVAPQEDWTWLIRAYCRVDRCGDHRMRLGNRNWPSSKLAPSIHAAMASRV